MSWVQYVARQYGSIYWERYYLRGRPGKYERNPGPVPLVYQLCQSIAGQLRTI